MVIAFITTDNRQNDRKYSETVPRFGTAPEALLQGFSRLPDVKIHVVSCTQAPMSSPEKLADNIWFHSLYVPKLGWLRTGYQGCIRAVRRELRRLRPDLVHGQGTERECALSAVFSEFRNVITIHGNMRLISKINKAAPFSFEWLAARLERLTIPRTDGVVCITNYTRRAVEDLAKRTWVVPNAVDINFFDVQPTPPQEVPTIICVGNVCVRKNQNAFIRALDQIAIQHKFRLLFLGHASGANSYGREFFGLIEQRPWCEHAGFEGRAALRKRFAEATMLVLPSLEDNCPMVVLEAMASGVPVVAANVGGVPDLVKDDVTGLFCDPLDSQSMKTAVSRMIEDPSLRRRLAETARAEARKRFHPEAVAKRHLEIYDEVLKTLS